MKNRPAPVKKVYCVKNVLTLINGGGSCQVSAIRSQPLAVLHGEDFCPGFGAYFFKVGLDTFCNLLLQVMISIAL